MKASTTVPGAQAFLFQGTRRPEARHQPSRSNHGTNEPQTQRSHCLEHGVVHHNTGILLSSRPEQIEGSQELKDTCEPFAHERTFSRCEWLVLSKGIERVQINWGGWLMGLFPEDITKLKLSAPKHSPTDDSPCVPLEQEEPAQGHQSAVSP